jgi:peptidoglycan/xylan/chitin deacetylase (PgdA/CDA1 family)
LVVSPSDTPPERSRGERVARALGRPIVRNILSRFSAWRGVLVLNYHRIGDHADPWDRSLWSASAEELDAQLAMLADQAEVIGPDEIETARRERRRGRRVLLTFDDGYRDNYEIAYPLLRRHGLRATFFLTTGFVDSPQIAWWDELAWMVCRAKTSTLPAGDWLGGPVALEASGSETAITTLVARYKTLPSEHAQAFLDYVASATGSGRPGAQEAEELWMTWEMARELRDGGMAIGGHTVTHPVFARISIERTEEEVAHCAERLQAELGEPMRWFAYPVGARDTFTPETQRILREHGVQLAFSFYGGYAGFSGWDPLDVPRVHIGSGYGPELLRATVWIPQLFARERPSSQPPYTEAG